MTVFIVAGATAHAPTLGLGQLQLEDDNTDVSLEMRRYFKQHPLKVGNETVEAYPTDFVTDADWNLSGKLSLGAEGTFDSSRAESMQSAMLYTFGGFLGGGLPLLIAGPLINTDAVTAIGVAVTVGCLIAFIIEWILYRDAQNHMLSMSLDRNGQFVVRHHGLQVGSFSVTLGRTSVENGGDVPTRDQVLEPVFAEAAHKTGEIIAAHPEAR